MRGDGSHVPGFVHHLLVPAHRPEPGMGEDNGPDGIGLGFHIRVGQRDHKTMGMPMLRLCDSGRDHIINDADEGVFEQQLLSLLADLQRIEVVIGTLRQLQTN